jgi:Raf kinase inhibitor-like YbhB/YbcL family protein
MADFRLTSSAFEEGQPIPQKYTCEGEDVSPPLTWSGAPEGTVSLALVVDDPDAPGGTFTHWLAWGIDVASGELGEGVTPPAEGLNDFGSIGWRGPCPPPGHGRHRYIFRLYALRNEPGLPPGARKPEVERALAELKPGVAELTGTFER